MSNACLILLLLAASAGSKAVMDKLQFRPDRFRGKGPWWDPAQSWKNKYKNGDPGQGERFWLSSTVLVWATDGWHFFQMLHLSLWQLALAFAMTGGWYVPLCFAGIKTLFSLTFELFFRSKCEV